ncbi:hypothetical protein RJT34_15660 [Clitoria ternatea]|uniref:Uncharacterized protein n=1 Tax=Clitoria ternatea TaxID=43366 RepID=A0AAN9PC67_CLITE
MLLIFATSSLMELTRCKVFFPTHGHTKFVSSLSFVQAQECPCGCLLFLTDITYKKRDLVARAKVSVSAMLTGRALLVLDMSGD